MANPVLGKSLCYDCFFLGLDFALGTVSMEMVQSVYFCFGTKPATSKLATKTAKKKCEYSHSSHWNYQKKLKRLKFYWNFKDGWRRRTFLGASHWKYILLSETECHMWPSLGKTGLTKFVSECISAHFECITMHSNIRHWFVMHLQRFPSLVNIFV